MTGGRSPALQGIGYLLYGFSKTWRNGQPSGPSSGPSRWGSLPSTLTSEAQGLHHQAEVLRAAGDLEGLLVAHPLLFDELQESLVAWKRASANQRSSSQRPRPSPRLSRVADPVLHLGELSRAATVGHERHGTGGGAASLEEYLVRRRLGLDITSSVCELLWLTAAAIWGLLRWLTTTDVQGLLWLATLWLAATGVQELVTCYAVAVRVDSGSLWCALVQ